MTNSQDALVYAMVVDYFDPLPALTKKFLLKYYPETNEAEMVDLKSRRLFLKRSSCPDTLSSSDFYIGAKVLLYGRDLVVTEWADKQTANALGPRATPGLVILSPAAVEKGGKIIDALIGGERTLAQLKLLKLDDNQAADLASMLGVVDDAGEFQAEFTSGNIAAGVLHGEDILTHGAQVCSGMEGAYWVDDSEQQAEINRFLFGKDAYRRFGRTATFDSCTCCVVKPHAIKAGHAGRILSQIMEEGYEVSAMEMFHLTRTEAEEFMEVYKGVIPEYEDTINEMVSGPCLALELRAEDAVKTFRQSAGPWDIEMAKELQPGSLRGAFGVDRARSGVHCTDLKEDGVSESQYFFDLLVNNV
ncbi:unnamed protein product [Chrysoparadoxa australica]